MSTVPYTHIKNLYIDGSWAKAHGDEAVLNPATEAVIGHAPVEGGLQHAPLPAPKSPFAGHDAVAKQDLDAINALALGVIAVIRQQHPFDVVGMIDDIVEHAAAGREYPVDIAESGKVILQSRQ